MAGQRPCRNCGDLRPVTAKSLDRPLCRKCRKCSRKEKPPCGYCARMPRPQPHQPGEPCRHQARAKTRVRPDPPIPPLTCRLCAGHMHRTPGSSVQGVATCRPCRNLGRGTRATRCSWCADRLHAKKTAGQYCSRSCYARADGDRRRIRAITDPRICRRAREQAAPGLTSTQRTRLLHQWRQAGRRCAYCPAIATTVDHVVPLVRGGTNHEGNLAPCCKRCNSSKAGLLIVEWRTGRRLPRLNEPLPWAA